jgi:hypothetical protein
MVDAPIHRQSHRMTVPVLVEQIALAETAVEEIPRYRHILLAVFYESV